MARSSVEERWLAPRQREETVGMRFLLVTGYTLNAPAEVRAEVHEEFAKQFDQVPLSQEPYAGWGAEIAVYCRAAARILRGGDPNAPENRRSGRSRGRTREVDEARTTTPGP